jgi:signal peptide peptidase SppA
MPRNAAHHYDHLIAFALEHPWALTASMRGVVVGILARRLAGEDPDVTVLAAAREARAMRVVPSGGDGAVTAVIPIQGVLAPRMNLFSDVSGGTTFDALTKHLQAAVADPQVKTIVFDVDSPGGNVAGASEFAREVLRARATKRVIAQSNHLMASAAYWGMAGASEIVASPSSLVGAIGVYTLHDDISAALEQLGIKREVISAGKYKGEGADGGPLSEEARAHVQGLIDGTYGRFVGDVAKGRGVKPSEIRNGFGQGRTLSAEAALEAGLIDRIATLDDTLARVSPSPKSGGALRATTFEETPPRHTDQEPPVAATSQDAGAGLDELIAFEQRVLALVRKGCLT